MKLNDLFNEQWSDDEDGRDTHNPLSFDREKVYDSFILADEVEGELVDRYKKENGIDKFKSPKDYSKVIRFQREKFGYTMDVPVNQITGSEDKLYGDHLKKLSGGEEVKSSSKIPLLYKINNDYIVGDGNHRIAQAVSQGAETVNALVLDLIKIKQDLEL